MKRSLMLAALALLCTPMFGTTSAQAQATRTWVSGVGDDVNPCSRTAPCKTFAGAISKTANGGEINCLDPGGFGAVTITKSITIDCIGTMGSILASGTNGVNINDSATGTPGTIVVSLKNLSIQGAGSGLTGINFVSGFSLNVDNVTVANFKAGNARGLSMAVTNAGAKILNVSDSYFWNNGIFAPASGAGIHVQPAIAGGIAAVTLNNVKVGFNSTGIVGNSGTGVVTMAINNSTISSSRSGGILASSGVGTSMLLNNTHVIGNIGIGVQANGAASTVRLNASSVLGNDTGLGGNGVFRSYKNNAINGNGVDGTPQPQENFN